MPDGQFFQSVCLILCDLFAFRVDMTSNQFFDSGFAEKKLILVLNIYDILKNTRKNIKINDKLGHVEVGAPYASDQAVKEYQVINHKDKVSKKMQFKINTEMQQR